MLVGIPLEQILQPSQGALVLENWYWLLGDEAGLRVGYFAVAPRTLVCCTPSKKGRLALDKVAQRHDGAYVEKLERAYVPFLYWTKDRHFAKALFEKVS